jgi:hypothetical protein
MLSRSRIGGAGASPSKWQEARFRHSRPRAAGFLFSAPENSRGRERLAVVIASAYITIVMLMGDLRDEDGADPARLTFLATTPGGERVSMRASL